ncbi:hypothetical protein ABTN72_19770, partial [Acinetobacter baumannii]
PVMPSVARTADEPERPGKPGSAGFVAFGGEVRNPQSPPNESRRPCGSITLEATAAAEHRRQKSNLILSFFR